MDITAADIQHFFAGQCSAEQAEQIARYLSEHPQALGDMFENEWIETEGLNEEEKMLMLDQIHRHTETIAPVKKIRLYKRTMALAASLLAIALTGYLLLFPSYKEKTSITSTAEKTSAPWMMLSNVTAKTTLNILDDGSKVELQPSALIRYHSFKSENKREIYLSGNAVFKVAKDTNKPFTVYAGGVATTALGTKFNVMQKDNKVTVQLFEGKVRISAVTALKGWLQKELFLIPGQEFIYDPAASLFTVRNIRKAVKESTVRNTGATPFMKESPAILSGNWYMFNNQPLPHVFEQLEELYSVQINYNQQDFKNVYFIGRFEKADSLEHILNNIALLKKLTVRHTGNRYIITRKKP